MLASARASRFKILPLWYCAYDAFDRFLFVCSAASLALYYLFFFFWSPYHGIFTTASSRLLFRHMHSYARCRFFDNASHDVVTTHEASHAARHAHFSLQPSLHLAEAALIRLSSIISIRRFDFRFQPLGSDIFRFAFASIFSWCRALFTAAWYSPRFLYLPKDIFSSWYWLISFYFTLMAQGALICLLVIFMYRIFGIMPLAPPARLAMPLFFNAALLALIDTSYYALGAFQKFHFHFAFWLISTLVLTCRSLPLLVISFVSFSPHHWYN